MDDLEGAWDDLPRRHAAGWFVGRPTNIEGRGLSEQYPFDPHERRSQ